MRRLRREPPVHRGGPRRDALDREVLLPVLHAGRDRSREPPPRAGPPPQFPAHRHRLHFLLRSPSDPNAHLHLLRGAQSPGHRAGLPGGPFAILRRRRAAGELRGVR